MFKQQAEKVVLSLGSNLGRRKELLSDALELLELNLGNILRKSLLYQTAPWGFESASPFLNQVAIFSTNLPPHEVLHVCLNIEKSLGRDRSNQSLKENRRYVERTMDIDVLFYGKKIVETPDLIIPHPRIEERMFVLKPLCEIAPTFVHPILGKTIEGLLAVCADKLMVEVFVPK